MKKEKDSAGRDKDAGKKTVDGKTLPKLQLTKKLKKKIDSLRGKDPNIYPLW